MLPRLVHGWNLTPALQTALPESPLTYARRLWFDTLVYDPRPIQYLLELVGPDRLVVGSDYPFGVAEKPPGRALAQLAVLGAADRAAIATGNALRFLFALHPVVMAVTVSATGTGGPNGVRSSLSAGGRSAATLAPL